MVKEPDWDNPKLTIGDLYHPAMKIKDPDEAATYFSKMVNYVALQDKSRPRKTVEEHVKIQKSNLGYFAGYYDSETMARVNRLFECVHPIFGNTLPTAESAFRQGEQFAKGKIKAKAQPKGVPKGNPKPKRMLILED